MNFLARKTPWSGLCLLISYISFPAIAGSAKPIVVKKSQTLTLKNLPKPGVYSEGTAIPLNAKASSGLSVYFATTAPKICHVIDSSIITIASGRCTFVAIQAGNDTYASVLVNNSFETTVIPKTILGLGAEFSCALLKKGSVKCWGSNEKGQLGIGDTLNKNIPQDISSLNSGVTSISAGLAHACALSNKGIAKCWGSNTYGQLGLGNSESQSTPQDIKGLNSGLAAITTGWNHTCILLNTGAIKCWGDNSLGQLGVGYGFSKSSPQGVLDLNEMAIAIAAGGNHTCASLNSGIVKCWGENLYGQLGTDISDNKTILPQEVVGLKSVKSLTAGAFHTCALLYNDSVKCWGNNDHGQLGIGNYDAQVTPQEVSNLRGVQAISAGDLHTCALLKTGAVKCWGFNAYGQLGIDEVTDQTTPQEIRNLSSEVTAIGGGGNHTCAIFKTGNIKCWGNNEHGELGNDWTGVLGRSMENELQPVDVNDLNLR